MVKDENQQPKNDLRRSTTYSEIGEHLIKAYQNLPTLCLQIYNHAWQHMEVWATVLKNVLCENKYRSRLTDHHLSDIFFTQLLPSWAKLWQHHQKHGTPSFPLSRYLGSIKLARVSVNFICLYYTWACVMLFYLFIAM